jgi:sensor histidine kinase YesM
MSTKVMRKSLHRFALVFAAWLPFFAIWVYVARGYANAPLSEALLTSAISMGSASLLGLPVWYLCKRWPWPVRVTIGFYLLHIFFAATYTVLWFAVICWLDAVRYARPILRIFHEYVVSNSLGWQLLIGTWIYGLFAGVSYALQTRDRLHEKEALAMRAEALATAARLDALRARLNPHFLFNALHTLAALVKFQPTIAESAIERLGDMLRYTLKEDSRELVEFSEEYEFTKQYLVFEQLRYEDRLKVEINIDPESFNCELLPFAIQTLAENAVHHAISVRPEGGSICITTLCRNGRLSVQVRDDGPAMERDSANSHHFGLRALRERLRGAYGPLADLRVQSGPNGFEAGFEVPSSLEASVSLEGFRSEHL